MNKFSLIEIIEVPINLVLLLIAMVLMGVVLVVALFKEVIIDQALDYLASKKYFLGKF